MFRQCCASGHADARDAASYAGDEHHDVMGFNAFQEAIYRVALLVYHKDKSTTPVQKLDMLVYVIASSEGRRRYIQIGSFSYLIVTCVDRLQQQLHGTTKGRTLHDMQAQTLTTIDDDKSNHIAFDVVKPEEEEQTKKSQALTATTIAEEDPLLNPSNSGIVFDLLEEFQAKMMQQVCSSPSP